MDRLMKTNGQTSLNLYDSSAKLGLQKLKVVTTTKMERIEICDKTYHLFTKSQKSLEKYRLGSLGGS